jgi:Glyoxalase-like domain
MITRFDQIILAVRDLEIAIEQFRFLGFDVEPGGSFLGMGMHNATIRFGLPYINLVEIDSPVQAVKHIPGINVLLNVLDIRDSAHVGFALNTTDIQQGIDRFRNTELASVPIGTQTAYTDGRLIGWRLFIPGGIPWRQVWPFLVQWDLPDEQREVHMMPRSHMNGALGIVRVGVGVRDLEKMVEGYQHHSGLEPWQQDTVSYLGARRVSFRIGESYIDLLSPLQRGPLQEEMDAIGEGTFEVQFAVKNLEESRAFLDQRGVHYEMDAAGPGLLLIAQQDTLDTRFVLVQATA